MSKMEQERVLRCFAEAMPFLERMMTVPRVILPPRMLAKGTGAPPVDCPTVTLYPEIELPPGSLKDNDDFYQAVMARLAKRMDQPRRRD